MRKLSVGIYPNAGIKFISKKIVDKFESIKLIELLKLDFNKGIIAGIFEIVLKDDYIIEDLQLPKQIINFKLLKITEKKYTC